MAKYRKKEAVVEAFQWFKADPYSHRGIVFYETGIAEFYVITVGGQHAYLADRDYIIEEPSSIRHRPCKPDLFEAVYDLVEELGKGAAGQGEFPREAIKEVVCVLLGYDMISHLPEINQAIDKIESLCNGESARPEPAHPNGSNCPNPNNEGLCGCKPVCQTCGGSKWKCVLEDHLAPESKPQCSRWIGCNKACTHWEPCPDCTDKPLRTDKGREGRRRVQTDRRDLGRGEEFRDSLEYLRRVRIRRTPKERRK